MYRRKFLWLSLWSSLSTLLIGCTDKEKALLNELDLYIDSLSDKGYFSRLGESYLSSHPAENDQRTLKQLIVQDLSEPLADAIPRKIQKDFQTNKTVRLHRWEMSVTEGQISALIHLKNTDHEG